MEFRFRIRKSQVSFIAEDSEERANPTWEGNPGELVVLQDWADNALGPFGHPVVDSEGWMRPGDLYFALLMSEHSWKLLEGEISEFESAPEGAVS